MTVLVSASIVAQNAAAVRVAGPRLILAVASLHIGALYLDILLPQLSTSGPSLQLHG